MKVSIGDAITALGHTYTVGKIIYQYIFQILIYIFPLYQAKK